MIWVNTNAPCQLIICLCVHTFCVRALKAGQEFWGSWSEHNRKGRSLPVWCFIWWTHFRAERQGKKGLKVSWIQTLQGPCRDDVMLHFVISSIGHLKNWLEQLKKKKVLIMANRHIYCETSCIMSTSSHFECWTLFPHCSFATEWS